MKKNVGLNTVKISLAAFTILFASGSLYAAGWADSLKGKLDKVNEKASSVSEKINEKAQKVTDVLDETFDPQSEDNQTMSDSIKTTSEKVSKAAEEITPEQEYYIGRAVAAKILSGTPRARNKSSVEFYLNQICQAIVINSDQPELYNGYHVALIDSDALNAVSTPGGHILIGACTRYGKRGSACGCNCPRGFPHSAKACHKVYKDVSFSGCPSFCCGYYRNDCHQGN